jgi:hypothetical protein
VSVVPRCVCVSITHSLTTGILSVCTHVSGTTVNTIQARDETQVDFTDNFTDPLLTPKPSSPAKMDRSRCF